MLKKLPDIPSKAGVYIFKDSKKNVLYVGKAKNLKNRLKSYFQKSADLDQRKSAMVKSIKDFSYIVTGNELEALILEANLIKQYKPRFNVILRDDKNYPYLKLTTNEEWPRLEVVRRIKRDGALYFGPYVPSGSMWEALSFIRKNFLLRTCKYPLDKPMKPCLQHQMIKCSGPCAGLISKKNYMGIVSDVRLFIQGKKKELLEMLEKKMEKLSEEMKYEDAARIRDSINNLKHIWESQKVIAPELGNSDVIGFCRIDNATVFQIFFIREGMLIGTKDFYLKNISDLTSKELCRHFIEQFYSKEIVPPEEIIISERPEDINALSAWLSNLRKERIEAKNNKVKIIIPARGKRKELVRMAEENAEIALNNKKNTENKNLFVELKNKLSLRVLPTSIGALDVSTISGSESSGAFIYWEDGEFKKDMYRHFKIKTVQGVDDYSMMQEIAERTIRNLGEKLPSLVVIDGGKGQLEAARKAFDQAKIKDTEIVSVAKNPDRAFTLFADRPIDLEDGKAASLLLKKIRDEAHRFAIGFHRKLRDKRLMESPLEKIHGIGKKRRLELLKNFGSIENIRKASMDEIIKVKGFNKKIAESLINTLAGGDIK
jgi:excinuclease ABC subunit C